MNTMGKNNPLIKSIPIMTAILDLKTDSVCSSSGLSRFTGMNLVNEATTNASGSRIVRLTEKNKSIIKKTFNTKKNPNKRMILALFICTPSSTMYVKVDTIFY